MFFKLLIPGHLICLQVDKVGQDSSLRDGDEVQLQLGAGRLALALDWPHWVHATGSFGLDESIARNYLQKTLNFLSNFPRSS